MKRHTSDSANSGLKPARSETGGCDAGSQLLFDFDALSAPASVVIPHGRERPEWQFALRFAAILEAEPACTFDNAEVSRLAREIFGISAGRARDAYDAAEAGFNIYMERVGLDLSDPHAAIEWLVAEQARLPRQTRRDEVQVEFQQFSTPPAQAFVLVKAAALRPGMKVLEPSAGTGNIAVLARLAGADIDTNEIDERRVSLLSLQGFEPTAFDAERLDNLLPADKLYDAIVMNPPFSATGGRVRGHRTAFGARHVEQALLRLKPGGRLVAIVGRGMALERPTFRKWWAEIGQRYRVRANLGIDGSAYARFGTTFDNQIIVIDRDGSTANESDIIRGSGLSLYDAYELIKNLGQEDVYGRVRRNDEAAGGGSAPADVPAGSIGRNGPGSRVNGTPIGGRGRGRSATVADTADDGALDHLAPARDGAAGGACPDVDASARTRADGASAGSRCDAGVGGSLAAEHAGRDGDGIGQLETAAPPPALRIEDGTVFAAYRVQKAIIRGSQAHPANVVESTAMASVEPPDVTYQHHLPAEVIAEGRISDLQLEDVIYAGQATGTPLPDGSLKGHWNGDGTGIGKGREVYAFIYNELQQGRRKHVHISASHQLRADAERDRDAVGVPLPLIHQAKFKPKEAISADAGVLFTTYTMLSTDFGGERQRFKQLTDWLGPDFEGVIAFDEAHLMKNAAATPHGGNRNRIVRRRGQVLPSQRTENVELSTRGRRGGGVRRCASCDRPQPTAVWLSSSTWTIPRISSAQIAAVMRASVSCCARSATRWVFS